MISYEVILGVFDSAAAERYGDDDPILVISPTEARQPERLWDRLTTGRRS